MTVMTKEQVIERFEAFFKEKFKLEGVRSSIEKLLTVAGIVRPDGTVDNDITVWNLLEKPGSRQILFDMMKSVALKEVEARIGEASFVDWRRNAINVEVSFARFRAAPADEAAEAGSVDAVDVTALVDGIKKNQLTLFVASLAFDDRLRLAKLLEKILAGKDIHAAAKKLSDQFKLDLLLLPPRNTKEQGDNYVRMLMTLQNIVLDSLEKPLAKSKAHFEQLQRDIIDRGVTQGWFNAHFAYEFQVFLNDLRKQQPPVMLFSDDVIAKAKADKAAALVTETLAELQRLESLVAGEIHAKHRHLTQRAAMAGAAQAAASEATQAAETEVRRSGIRLMNAGRARHGQDQASVRTLAAAAAAANAAAIEVAQAAAADAAAQANIVAEAKAMLEAIKKQFAAEVNQFEAEKCRLLEIIKVAHVSEVEALEVELENLANLVTKVKTIIINAKKMSGLAEHKAGIIAEFVREASAYRDRAKSIVARINEIIQQPLGEDALNRVGAAKDQAISDSRRIDTLLQEIQSISRSVVLQAEQEARNAFSPDVTPPGGVNPISLEELVMLQRGETPSSFTVPLDITFSSVHAPGLAPEELKKYGITAHVTRRNELDDTVEKEPIILSVKCTRFNQEAITTFIAGLGLLQTRSAGRPIFITTDAKSAAVVHPAVAQYIAQHMTFALGDFNSDDHEALKQCLDSQPRPIEKSLSELSNKILTSSDYKRIRFTRDEIQALTFFLEEHKPELNSKLRKYPDIRVVTFDGPSALKGDAKKYSSHFFSVPKARVKKDQNFAAINVAGPLPAVQFALFEAEVARLEKTDKKYLKKGQKQTAKLWLAEKVLKMAESNPSVSYDKYFSEVKRMQRSHWFGRARSAWSVPNVSVLKDKKNYPGTIEMALIREITRMKQNERDPKEKSLKLVLFEQLYTEVMKGKRSALVGNAEAFQAALDAVYSMHRSEGRLVFDKSSSALAFFEDLKGSSSPQQRRTQNDVGVSGAERFAGSGQPAAAAAASSVHRPVQPPSSPMSELDIEADELVRAFTVLSTNFPEGFDVERIMLATAAARTPVPVVTSSASVRVQSHEREAVAAGAAQAAQSDSEYQLGTAPVAASPLREVPAGFFRRTVAGAAAAAASAAVAAPAVIGFEEFMVNFAGYKNVSPVVISALVNMDAMLGDTQVKEKTKILLGQEGGDLKKLEPGYYIRCIPIQILSADGSPVLAADGSPAFTFHVYGIEITEKREIWVHENINPLRFENHADTVFEDQLMELNKEGRVLYRDMGDKNLGLALQVALATKKAKSAVDLGETVVEVVYDERGIKAFNGLEPEKMKEIKRFASAEANRPGNSYRSALLKKIGGVEVEDHAYKNVLFAPEEVAQLKSFFARRFLSSRVSETPVGRVSVKPVPVTMSQAITEKAERRSFGFGF